MTRSPNFNALKMFDAAARHLNFRIAAEEMNVSQGAVAQQVRGLEADLGVRLFDRLPRGLALTMPGREYHTHISNALAIIEDATQKLHPLDNRITLSVAPSFASKWLVPKLPYFVEQHPDIEINTVASEKLANFRTDGIDVAIRQTRPPFDEDLSVTLLSELQLTAVCSPDFAASDTDFQALGDFAECALIQDSHRHWEKKFSDAGLARPERILQFNQTALAMDAAINGQGIAIAPGLLLETSISQNALRELWHAGQEGQEGFYIVHRDAETANMDAKTKVIDWLLSQG